MLFLGSEEVFYSVMSKQSSSLKKIFFLLSLKKELFHIMYFTFIGECMSDSFVDYTTCCSG